MDIEPMSISSPQKTPGNIGTPKSSSSYMPAYLIGNMNTPVNQAKSLQSAVGQVPQSNSLLKPRMTTVENSNQKVQGGPPVVPLNPLFQSPKSPRDGNGKFITGSTSMIHPMDDSSFQAEPMSPSQLDPFFQEGGEPNHDPAWITVFGFTSSATAFILKQFRQYGVILQHVINQEGGNWIHIQYKTKIQARKALSKNGKIYEGKIMIGVVPCISVPVGAQSNVNLESVPSLTSDFGGRTPFADISQNASVNLSTSEYGTPRNLSNIRRMDQSRSQSMSHLNSPSISRLTNQSSNLTPSKSSDSMMGKIGSYIFNW